MVLAEVWKPSMSYTAALSVVEGYSAIQHANSCLNDLDSEFQTRDCYSEAIS